MYSGTVLTRYSGRIIGTHQKIDRIARRHLTKLLIDTRSFPDIRTILQFEGRNGPDGIKRKSPARDEPWHYLNPFDDDDDQLVHIIQSHYDNLVTELRSGNSERAAFEAAWLAHALVDGLTPAHHYPYEKKLLELRGGEGLETRTSLKTKLFMPGETRRQKMRNNWKMWGPKGLFTTHGLFEMGVATIIAPLTLSETVPSNEDISNARAVGITEWFRRAAREVAVLDMYKNYYRKGWTPKLAWQVRHKLGPVIVQTVALAWYLAARDAGLAVKKS